MAKMSLKDKLAAARAGGPAQPAAEPPAEAAEPLPEPAAVEESSAAAPAAAPPPPPRPAPAQPGRKLSLKEKLAAAKAGGAAQPAGAAPAAPAPEPIEAAEVVAPETGEAPTASAPPAPTGRPLSLKEKLAAARGGAAAPAPAGGAAKPAAAKPAAPAAAKPAAARALPPLEKATDPKDLAEHLRRAGAERQKAAQADEPTKAAAKAPARKGAEAKVVPPRPSREAALTEGESRRGFMTGFLAGSMLVGWIIVGWAAFVAGISAFTVMSLRFMFPNVLAEPPSTIKVGLPSNFELGEVNETWKAQWGFWIVRSNVYNGNDTLYALSTICTHLGCPPNWLAGEQKFKCPCHGSGFYISGVNFEGPAPRPLERYKVSVGDDGQIVVDKSQKFQEELGQWSDPDSFIPVA
jgi:cytochrome b6-f complex iron-sulfur subunit